MKITHRLLVKKPKCMRYIDCADWYKTNGVWNIVAADTGNKYANFLLVLHELVELVLCEKKGITQKQVDDFDMNYKGRYEEYGRDPKAPYHKEHMFASKIETKVCKELGLDWNQYCGFIEDTFEKVKKCLRKK